MFDIIDDNGNEIKEELDILNSKIDAITYLESKGLNYKIPKIESVYPIGKNKDYHAEICRIEVLVSNTESEYIFVYAKLRDTDRNTIEVVDWEVSQSRFTGR